MRTIKEMTGNDEKVWVYIHDQEVWKIFTGMAAAEGFSFGRLPVGKWKYGYVVSVHSNGNMGHLPLFIWCRSFSDSVSNDPRKIDFSRFINGDKDYICRESHFIKT